ncbi:hypothetical protein [Thioalkalivibrio sp. ALJ24]|uniref:hypothetical protein n=1 Tax=Thioalkalivibrio sp. ALJ24 TaxID=545276 RepID=UPI0012EAA2F9|nr:hypothetical protein [Thioalkalivibrio sp. ALJ24]
MDVESEKNEVLIKLPLENKKQAWSVITEFIKGSKIEQLGLDEMPTSQTFETNDDHIEATLRFGTTEAANNYRDLLENQARESTRRSWKVRNEKKKKANELVGQMELDGIKPSGPIEASRSGPDEDPMPQPLRLKNPKLLISIEIKTGDRIRLKGRDLANIPIKVEGLDTDLEYALRGNGDKVPRELQTDEQATILESAVEQLGILARHLQTND